MSIQMGNLILFDVQDISKKLKLNPVTVMRFFRTGRLKGRKMGKRWYLTEEALRDYFKEPGSSQKARPKP